MDIYEYAMKLERDGEDFYRDLAKKAGNPGLSNILTKLADAEVKHFNVFKAMRENETVPATDAEILGDIRNIFEKIRAEKAFSVDVTQLDLYKEAQEIETRSRDFYLEKAEAIGDAFKRDIFLKIADEEKKHYFILENIINFVSRPSSWLENPEWHHLEEY